MYNFKLKNFLFFLVIATMMVPFEILMLPLYKEIIALHLIDTYTGVIIIGLCNASTIFFFRQYLSGLPRELLDAALAATDMNESYSLWQQAQEDVGPDAEALWVWFANVDHLYFARDGLAVAEQKLHPHGHGWSLVNNVDQWTWK